MSKDNTLIIEVLDIGSYVDYRIEIKRLEGIGYSRADIRKRNDSVEDLIGNGYNVAKVQHFDDDTLLPTPETVTILTRGFEL